MPKNLCAIRVVLLCDPKKSDGGHEGGHQRKGNRGNLSEDWELGVDHIKQGNQQKSNCDDGILITPMAPSASRYSLLVFCRPPLSLRFILMVIFSSFFYGCNVNLTLSVHQPVV